MLFAAKAGNCSDICGTFRCDFFRDEIKSRISPALGSATHLSNKRWLMERWVFQKMGKVGMMGMVGKKDFRDGKDGLLERWERWVSKYWVLEKINKSKEKIV